MAKSNGVPKIERGIPIPKKRGGHNKGKFSGFCGQLRKLQPLESILTEKPISTASRLVGLVKKATGAEFTCRSVDGGTRIWRLS